MRIATVLEPALAGEDRLAVRTHAAHTVVVVADGAGGVGGGAAAAQRICDAVVATTGDDVDWAHLLAGLDAAMARDPSPGWSTAVVVEIRAGRVRGASVGDSAAFVVAAGGLRELSARQRRKPLLGSGEAVPVAFGPEPLDGRLLVASDGLVKYVAHGRLASIAGASSTAGAAAALLDACRLPAGGLQDDVAIVLLGP